jgi:hypothetical protein
MDLYNKSNQIHEQLVGRAQQSFATRIYGHFHPVGPHPPYQGHSKYLFDPYKLNGTNPAPPQLTGSSHPIFFNQVSQGPGIPTTAEVSASQSPAAPQARSSSSPPPLHTSQALGSTPHRPADNGPRRIHAVPIESLSIIDPTIQQIVMGFLLAPWRLNQLEEPEQAGQSCYFQLIDEPKMNCLLCGKYERRAERLVSHLRGHFDHRPYPCNGRCGTVQW